MADLTLNDHISNLTYEFLSNLDDDLDFLESEVLNFSDSKEENSLRDAYAKVHSIKGTAGALGLEFISKVCHIFEDHLSEVDSTTPKSKCDTFLRFIDLLREYASAPPEHRIEKIAEFQERLSALSTNNRKMKFLVVQRTKSFLKRYRQILNGKNVDISSAKNGYDALGRILQEKFDVILCDSLLDLISGVELSRILKIIKHRNPYIKFVLVTSNEANPPEYADYVDYVVTKDIDYFMNLRKIFSELTEGKEEIANTDKLEESTPKSLPSRDTPPLKRILYIDDDKLIQSLVKASLKELNLEKLSQAYTGLEGIKLLGSDNPDMILLDYMLPDRIGPDVFKDIRANLDPKVPIIFLTGKNNKTDTQFLKDLGVTAIINKPFDPKTLATTLKYFWEKHWEEFDRQESA